MKKNLIRLAAALMLTVSLSATAQNDFKGIVTYNVTSSGEMATEVPEQIQNPQVKVMGDKVYLDERAASLFATNAGFGIKGVNLEGRKTTICYDFSQILAAISQMGEELATYRGDGKMMVSMESTQGAIDSLSIKDTEPGHFYLEYPEGQTKEIAGVSTQLARIHVYSEDGVESTHDIWFAPDMGPKGNTIFNGVKGLPMEMTLPLGEGRAFTVTATEVKKGKVKEVDFLMPEGFNKVTEEEFTTFMEEFSEVLQYLQEE